MALKAFADRSLAAAYGYREVLRVYDDTDTGHFLGVAGQRVLHGEWYATPASTQPHEGWATALHLPTRQHAFHVLAPGLAAAPAERKSRMSTRAPRTTTTKPKADHTIGQVFHLFHKGQPYNVTVEADEPRYVISGGTLTGQRVATLERCAKVITNRYTPGAFTDGPAPAEAPAKVKAEAPVAEPPAPPAPPAPPEDKPAPKARKPKPETAAAPSRKATGPVTKASQVAKTPKAKAAPKAQEEVAA